MPRLRKFSAKARRFRNDENGAVILWYSLLLTVSIALIGLAIDGAAYLNLHSSQQEVADAAALAGANMLDGTKGAVSRATTAATTTLGNVVKWSNDGSTGTTVTQPINTVAFYLTLAALNAGTTTSSDTAAYIKVVTKQRSYTASFIKLVSGTKTNDATATAVAVSQYVTCAPLQSFMCNPYEPTVGTAASTGDASTFMSSGNVQIGDMFLLVDGSVSGPGNWGLIQPPSGGSNEAALAPFWSTEGTSTCLAYNPGSYNVSTLTGNKAKFAVAGMNVRFDRMTSLSGVDLTTSAFPISGYTFPAGTDYSASSCSRSTSPPATFAQTNRCTDISANDNATNVYCGAEQSADYGKYQTYCTARTGSCPFPRDRKFTNLGTDPSAWGNMLKGDGLRSAGLASDLDAYWTNHHSGVRPSSLNTRYKIYEKEIDGTYPFVDITGGEPSQPQCAMGKPAATTVDRRLLNVAIVDCNYWGISGKKQLPTTNLTMKMFMTEPATSDGEVYAELVDVMQANASGGPVHHIVRLIR